ncbi:MAG: hypothetical protein HY788_05640 [Deltaproteobacteria bacterium]|nr:hypothetical protein [Deltaproteobacteria bacterium]
MAVEDKKDFAKVVIAILDAAGCSHRLANSDEIEYSETSPGGKTKKFKYTRRGERSKGIFWTGINKLIKLAVIWIACS